MSQTRITIRPLRLTDAHDVYGIMHMPNVLWGMSVLPSTTADAWSTIVAQWVADEHIHVFVAEIQEKAIGLIRLHVRTGRERHVGDVTLAVHDKHQRQGIGKMLLITALDLADNWLNLVRLELAVYTDNEQAIRLCQQFDFAIEGQKHYGAFRGGAYIDSYMLARLRIATNSMNSTNSMNAANEQKETTDETQ